MERLQCPACKNHSLIQTSNSYSCVICGYTYSQQLFEKDSAVKIMSKEESFVYELNQAAQSYFQNTLTNLKKNSKAVKYLVKRGFYNQQDIATYGFGFDNGLMFKHLLSLGYTENQLYYYGLVKYQTDTFQNRITIPIKDSLGRIMGFGGRIIQDDDNLKYINTSENPVFKKKMIFFGIERLNFQRPIILCEGYFDCISLQKYGFNAIATMGTALTIEHAILLKEIGQPVFLMYDGDKAGQKATMKNMHLLQSVGIQCKWVSLDDCKDPDDFLKKYGSEKLKEKIIHASNRKQVVLNNITNADITEIINYLYAAI